MDHIMKLLEESCPNHAQPIKHKFRDYGMMKNFKTSGSLSQGMEVDEVPYESDTTPFPGEDTVMMIYDGCPLLGRRRMSNSSLGIPACYDWGCGNAEM
jgi:hypothetical protein